MASKILLFHKDHIKVTVPNEKLSTVFETLKDTYDKPWDGLCSIFNPVGQLPFLPGSAVNPDRRLLNSQLLQ